jgi:hypothetical protein
VGKQLTAEQVRILPDPFRRGAGCGSLFWSGEMMEKRLPTVIVLFLFVVAISVAECLVCLLGGDL